jgi:diguanylate cyclase (GGDEF)-like protein/PAS domain S-box-containing protein
MRIHMKWSTFEKKFTAESCSKPVTRRKPMKTNGKVNILMVDDRPENLLALEAVLSDPDYNLVRAHSGEEALKHLLKDDFAVILLDVQMPGLNGFETAKLIKMRQKSMNTPIIFVTAISKEPENVFQGYSVGAIDYMFKPFEPDTLRQKIENFAQMYSNTKQLEIQTEQLRQTTLELRKAEALARVIGDTSIDTMVTFTNQGKILTVNPVTKKMFGYAEHELLNQHITILLPLLAHDEYGSALFNAEYPGEKNTIGKVWEIFSVRKDGSEFPAEIQLGKAYVNQQVIYACTIRDITERKEQLAALEYQALHDGLTGLPNRTLLYDRIIQGILVGQGEKQSLSLIILDLDRFKDINDTLGHYYGDILLQHIGQRIKKVVKESDTVARLGGDEFAVLLPSGNVDSAVCIANEIIQSLEAPFEIEKQTLTIQPSLGIAIFPEHGEDVETLVRRADVAMYTAKRSGTGFAIYSTEKDPNSLNRLMLMNDLRQAIDKDELMLYYQPKVDMKTNQIIEVEALVRWIHPQYGFIPPDEFIPIAEQNSLIHPFTLWVLKKAMKQCYVWKNQGIPLKIAVNLSTRNLQDRLPEQVAAILNECQMDSSSLVLEITESFLMEDPIRAKDILIQLKAMGVKLSIDDFGTGYSSLGYLKKLPVDEIKVDKSFVIQMNEDKNDAMIVRSIINLAHNLGITVVAEGIENLEIWNMLIKLNCDVAQGYFISRPLPSDDLSIWLTQNAHDFVAAAKE